MGRTNTSVTNLSLIFILLIFAKLEILISIITIISLFPAQQKCNNQGLNEKLDLFCHKLFSIHIHTDREQVNTTLDIHKAYGFHDLENKKYTLSSSLSSSTP